MLSRALITLLALLIANPLWAQQGPINPPIYATGIINVAGGATVNTNITNTRDPPANLNVFAQGNITTWNIALPSPSFDGQTIGIGCPGGHIATLNITAPVTVGAGGPTTCNTSAGPFCFYQFSVVLNEWLLIFNVANSGGGGGNVLSGRTPLVNGGAFVTGAFTGTCITQDVTNPANTSYGIEAPTSLTLFGTGTDVIKWICG